MSARTTWVAGAIAFVVVAGIAASVLTKMEPALSRSQMIAVVNAAQAAATEAAERHRSQGKFAADRREGPSPYVRRLTIEPSGRIVAEISLPADRDLDGRTVVFEPELREGRVAGWRCYVPEARLRDFPPRCRFRTAAEAIAQ